MRPKFLAINAAAAAMIGAANATDAVA